MFRIKMALFLLSLFGCNNEKFRADGAAGGKDHAGIDCTKPSENKPQTVRADYGNNAVIEAKLCPQALELNPSSPTQVVFIVDFSGSMLKADSIKEGRCDRMAAAEVVVRNFLATVDSPSTLQFSVISFEDKAVLQAGKISGAIFNPTNGDYFCQGILSGSVTKSNTNYEAAFKMAEELLASMPQAEKRIYFLSDGKPGASSTIVQDEEVDYDITVRKAMNDALVYVKRVQALNFVKLYALFLDWTRTGSVDTKEKPVDLMAEITGDPANVKVVEDSASLPKEIQTLTPVPNTQITPAQILIEVRANGYPTRSYRADPSTFVWDGAETSPVAFKTLPMQLHGTKGQVVRNEILVSARDSRFASVVFYMDWDQSNSAALK